MSTSEKIKFSYQEGDLVLCFHGPLLYEAKCIKAEVRNKVPHYLIHYSGWNKSWDEWVTCPRVLKINDENLKKQKELFETHGTSKIASKIKASARKNTTPNIDKNPEAEKPSSQDDKSSQDGNVVDSKRKRQKVEDSNDLVEHYVVKSDLSIKITDELRQILVEDHNNICNNNKLVNLPSNNTIEMILEEYTIHKLEKKFDKNVITAIVEGLKDYFNSALANKLLYKAEKPQYAELIKNSTKKPSEIYGSVHLLRLFVKIGEYLSYTYWDEMCVKQLVLQIEDVISYINENRSNLFSNKSYISQK